MKKLVAFLVLAMVAGGAWAQLSFVGDSYVHRAEDGTWYRASGTDTWGGAAENVFDGYDFGLVSALTLGGQIQTWQPGEGTTVTMFWEVKQGEGVVSSGDFDLPYLGAAGNNDKWEDMTGENVAAGLAGGEYDVGVWFNASRGETTIYDNNGDANFVASFETQAIPEPATMSLLGLGAMAMVLRRKLRK